MHCSSIFPVPFPIWFPGWNFLFGYLSGCSATVVAYPLDCLRTRLVGQGEPKVEGGRRGEEWGGRGGDGGGDGRGGEGRGGCDSNRELSSELYILMLGD